METEDAGRRDVSALSEGLGLAPEREAFKEWYERNFLRVTNLDFAADIAEEGWLARAKSAADERAELEALRKDAQRYRKLRNASMDERNRLEHYAGPELDKALDALPDVRDA